MKKLFFLTIAAFLLSNLIFPLSVSAASANLLISANKSDYNVGDIFKLYVSVISDGNNLQVVRAKITYPADLLQVQGFTLGTLFPQKSPGESIGNGIIYVGGYRIGPATSSNGLLGYATFKVLKEGKATIDLVSGSRMVTPDGVDIYGGGNSITLNLNAVPKPEEAPLAEKPEVKISLITPVVTSNTNPDNTWSKNNTVVLAREETTYNQGYVLNLSKEELSDIGNKITTTDNSYKYENLEDGIWTFYIKAKYPTGFSPIGHYTIKIDTNPPSLPYPTIESRLDTNGQNIFQIFFASTDELSGINSYQIKFDDNSFQTATSPYTLSSAEENAKTVTIKAFDNANNESTAALAIGGYISNLKEQQAKKALFDIQASSAGQKQLVFYLVLSAIIAILVISVIVILVKKRKKS